MKTLALALIAACLAACGPDKRLPKVEEAVKSCGSGIFELVSLRKTGGRSSPTTAEEHEIAFAGEARILADTEVSAPDQAGGVDIAAYERNFKLFQLFGAGPLKAGETKPFSSICVFSGGGCRAIVKDTKGSY